MKTLGKGIGGALLSLAFFFGMFAAMSSTANAQFRNDRYYGQLWVNRGSSTTKDRVARSRCFRLVPKYQEHVFHFCWVVFQIPIGGGRIIVSHFQLPFHRQSG